MTETDKKNEAEKVEGGADSKGESKSESKGDSCPECEEPIDDLRATCKNCGYEYKDSDYGDTEAGNEFLVGSNIDDEGEEITDRGPGAEEGAGDEGPGAEGGAE